MFRYYQFALLVPLVAGALRNVVEEQQQLELERELPSTPFPSAGGMVFVKSTNGSFEETYNSLVDGIRNVNPKLIAAEIDHAAGAASVGLDLLPNRLVVIANPALGTPVIEENPLAGLDLPQKFLVWEDADGDVIVGYNHPDYLVARHSGVENANQQLMTMRGALSNFASIATGVEQDFINNMLQPMTFPTSPCQSGLLVIASSDDFVTSRDRLLEALNNEGGPSIFFEVDHAANSNGVLNNNYLVVFGNPNVGAPLIQQSATAGIDLPLKILITEADDGTVYVSANKIDYLASRHTLSTLNEELTNIRRALLNFVGIAADKELRM